MVRWKNSVARASDYLIPQKEEEKEEIENKKTETRKKKKKTETKKEEERKKCTYLGSVRLARVATTAARPCLAMVACGRGQVVGSNCIGRRRSPGAVG